LRNFKQEEWKIMVKEYNLTKEEDLKKFLQDVIDKMKNTLQEYWVNECGLPLEIQLHSMALMDLTIEDLKIGIVKENE
jgi:hypothetical protein